MGLASGASVAWEAAFDALEPDLQTRLSNAAAECETDVLNIVLSEAEKNRKFCLQKRWRFRLGSEQIILRDLFDKIIAWANEFKAVGDIAVQFDPSPAAIPWAGVRFLLQVFILFILYIQLSCLVIDILQGLRQMNPCDCSWISSFLIGSSCLTQQKMNARWKLLL